MMGTSNLLGHNHFFTLRASDMSIAWTSCNQQVGL